MTPDSTAPARQPLPGYMRGPVRAGTSHKRNREARNDEA